MWSNHKKKVFLRAIPKLIYEVRCHPVHCLPTEQCYFYELFYYIFKTISTYKATMCFWIIMTYNNNTIHTCRLAYKNKNKITSRIQDENIISGILRSVSDPYHLA